MAKIFHPLLALIASGTDRELAKYVQFLKEENKILRSRIKVEVHTKPEERKRLLEFGKALGRAIEELITIVSPSTFYRWMRDEHGKKSKHPKGGQRKPREVRATGWSMTTPHARIWFARSRKKCQTGPRSSRRMLVRRRTGEVVRAASGVTGIGRNGQPRIIRRTARRLAPLGR